MSTKLYAAFLPLFAVAAFVVLPAAAQATVPHWYSCENVGAEKGKFENNVCTKEGGKKEFEWVRIKEGTKEKPFDVQVKTKGTLVLEIPGNKITCKVKDAGSIWNPAGGGAGEDEITEFLNSECVAEKAICATGEILEVLALNLPWYSELEEVAGVIRDRIYAEVGGVEKGLEIGIECNKAGTKTVEDVFTGILTPKIGVNAAEFGPGSGELEDPAHNKAKVSGTDTIEGPAGDVGITAKNP
jgi:hypothetical protein